MLSDAMIRQYAHGARVSPEVAGQDIALHYALAMLGEHGLVGRPPGGGSHDPHGPLLFKGGTALRKCVFGSVGRFSEDIDLDAREKNGFEAEIEDLFQGEYHGLRFHFATCATPTKRTSAAASSSPMSTDRARSSCRSPIA